MRLHPLGREVYAVQVTLDPSASGTWQASFDGGTTWLDGTLQTDGVSFGWLVAGPLNDGIGAVFQFAPGQLAVTPVLRLQVGAEDIVLNGPSIEID